MIITASIRQQKNPSSREQKKKRKWGRVSTVEILRFDGRSHMPIRFYGFCPYNAQASGQSDLQISTVETRPHFLQSIKQGRQDISFSKSHEFVGG
jgi:hypothetical protein